MPEYDYLVVGAGLYGATFAHQAARAGKKCLVIERRDHVGGNIYTENVGGIDVHVYGAHIFHTSDKEVWDFVNSIVPFHPFINSPIAIFGDRRYNLPFNMNTFHQMWGVDTPEQAMEIIEAQRAEARKNIPDPENPANLEEQALMLAGRDIFETLVKGYTEKQWGRRCTELPAFIIRRLPFRMTYDNNYFNDTYQGIPDGGYTPLIEGLLEGIEVRTGIDFLSDREHLESLASKVVYTGCIDEYFDFCFGPLQYRSVRFETTVLEQPDFQGNAVMNYTSADIPWTRIIEHKHFDPSRAGTIPVTVISKEFSQEWHPGMEPYYPVNDSQNNALYEKYKELAGTKENIIFGGRLGAYRYNDMAPTVAQVLAIKDF